MVYNYIVLTTNRCGLYGKYDRRGKRRETINLMAPNGPGINTLRNENPKIKSHHQEPMKIHKNKIKKKLRVNL